LCNYLRQQYGVPVCQYIPADVVDAYVVQAFLAALAPLELDAYSKAIQAQRQRDEAVEHAQRQQLERLQYQVALAERQFHQVDPDNRLVAAELEARWETALRELKVAQDAYAKAQYHAPFSPGLSPALQAAFTAIGQRLPELWSQDVLARAQKKALLRCLIDKVVIHRSQRDTVHTRIVWKGGDTTTVALPIPVGSWTELSHCTELDQRIVRLHRQGLDDDTIARQLSAEGYRSPMDATKLLPSTVKGIRLQHRLLVTRSQSHPRHIPGSLTVPQIATVLRVSPHWLYDRIDKGAINVSRDQATGLYLFPDTPQTLDQFKQLQAGSLQQLRFEATSEKQSLDRHDKAQGDRV
jgi:hypothetical protein